jgi:basic amino acid/polyamine antiporter, APA family
MSDLIEPEMERRLGLFDSIMMMTGIMIGSGIFLTTGIMARSLPSVPLLLLAWFTGGLIVLAGAVTYAELGALLPQAGGQYVYLREAYGPLWGFLFGWKMFLINKTGSIATLGAAFAAYFGGLIPELSPGRILLTLRGEALGIPLSYSLSAGQLLAVGLILLFSLFNFLGVGLGKNLQNGLTTIKIGTIIAFVALGLSSGRRIVPQWRAAADSGLSTGGWLTGFGVALVAVFWAFDGWQNINYVAGEIRRPGRNIPRTLLFGCSLVTLLYVLVNVVYVHALPVSSMAGEVRVADLAVQAQFGSGAAGIFSAVIMISILGALNGAIFAGPRVFWAMARDGLFFRRAGSVHPRFRTPGNAVWMQAAWACLLALSADFEQLFTFTMFIGILFWVAGAAAVFTLRRRWPDRVRPYRAWGYPIIPAFFVITLAGILLNTLFRKPVESLAGLLLLVPGVPIYTWWKKRNQPRA